jgi:PAS domain S-box-containing protein
MLESTDDTNTLLAAIIDSSDDAIISKTLDGIVTSWNRGAEIIFGYKAAEAIGQHITLIIPLERHSEENEVLSRIRRGEKLEHFETVRQAKYGRKVYIWLTVSPVEMLAVELLAPQRLPATSRIAKGGRGARAAGDSGTGSSPKRRRGQSAEG